MHGESASVDSVVANKVDKQLLTVQTNNDEPIVNSIIQAASSDQPIKFVISSLIHCYPFGDYDLFIYFIMIYLCCIICLFILFDFN